MGIRKKYFREVETRLNSPNFLNCQFRGRLQHSVLKWQKSGFLEKVYPGRWRCFVMSVFKAVDTIITEVT